MSEDQADGSEHGETVKLCSLLETYCVPPLGPIVCTHSPETYCVHPELWDLLCALTALRPTVCPTALGLTVCPHSPGIYCVSHSSETDIAVQG